MNDDQNWHDVASADEVEADEALPVNVGETEIALCRVDGEIYAISNVCTHEYACMSDGFVEGDLIECPLHQAQFHIPTGKAMSSPAEVDLDTYPVKIIDNQVYVRVDGFA